MKKNGRLGIYWELYDAFALHLHGESLQDKVNTYWSSVKENPNRNELVRTKIRDLQNTRNKYSITNYFSKTKQSDSNHQTTKQPTQSKTQSTPDVVFNSAIPPRVHFAPRQAVIVKEMDDRKQQIDRQHTLRDMNLQEDEDKEKLAELTKKQEKSAKHLKRLQDCAKNNRIHRERKRKTLKTLQESNPNQDIFKSGSGRHPLEHKYGDLLQVIVDVVFSQSSADERRRSNVMNTCRTLDDLLDEVKSRGFHVSRTALYHRLLPKRRDSTEGKRHVITVPVKLIKATNAGRKKHPDAHFAMATVKYLKDLATMMGPGPVFYLSQDDKCRVHIGLPAATKQAPFLMLMSQRVTLPDHDFVVASQHKLIPSVYAACKIESTGVSYSGPTYIAIRSGKHDSSTAITHAFDFDHLFELAEFEDYLKNEGMMKPIVIITVDGGPDENPRYELVQQKAIEHFIKYDLDALFIATHAPGQSAYNIVERRMAPLSHDLAGLILPHDHFGSHLNSSLQCVNQELEKKNFRKAGEVLAEEWSKTVIDNQPVVTNYIDPDQIYPTSNQQTEKWKSIHMRTSQYLLQFVKCKNVQCCKAFRSNLDDVLKLTRFLPPPILYSKSTNKVFATSSTDDNGHFGTLQQRLSLNAVLPDFKQSGFKFLPYDYYCPSVIPKLQRRICRMCDTYFCSIKLLKEHRSSGCRIEPMIPEDFSDDSDEIGSDNEIEVFANNFDDESVPIFSVDDYVTPLYGRDTGY